MVKAIDCVIVVREFEFQSCYYVHFRANTLGKAMDPIILPVLYSHNQLYIHIYIQKHVQHNNDERTQFLVKIYLSVIEWVVCERELETEKKTATYWAHNSSGYHSLSFPFSRAAQPGSASAVTWFSFQHLLFNWSELPVAGVI